MVKTRRLHIKKSIWIVIAVLIVLIALALSYNHAGTRLTYIEYKIFNTKNETFLRLSTKGDSITQEFSMPYEILEGIAIKINTFNRDNNSEWQLTIRDEKSKEVVYNDVFNASLIPVDQYYHIKLDKNMRVNKGELYSFTISPISVSYRSSLGFYTSNGSTIEKAKLLFNGKKQNADMCFEIYGGDVDSWWYGLYSLLALFVFFLLILIYTSSKDGRNPFNNKYVQAMLICAISFILLCTFAKTGFFTDENDNVRGGMIIANGGVLYRDYITQHTPVVYYLCAFFALLGAGSMEQFKLSYYLMEAIIWGLLYIRHVDFFGKRKMIAAPILVISGVASVFPPYGTQILSDGWQGLLFAVLGFEFIRYCDDMELGWLRSIVLSICILGSVGAAFISVYPLALLLTIVIIMEIQYWNRKKKKSLGLRYSKLLISLAVPFIVAVVYFKLNHALKWGFEQAYLFNREVYPKYIDGMGTSLLEPIITAIQFYIGLLPNKMGLLFSESPYTIADTIQLCAMIVATVFLIIAFKKGQRKESVGLLLLMVFSGARGGGFHSLATWYMVFLIIAVYYDLLAEYIPKISKIVSGILLFLLLGTFVSAVGENLMYQPGSVSELESLVVALTEKDEDQNIYLDAWSYDSIYLMYKNRNPVNPSVYMLPWYMDWYEKRDVKALEEKKPTVAVYNINNECWGYTHYNNVFDKRIKNQYTRLGDSDEGWKYYIWVRKE